jgi:phosphate transport system permease protein
MSDLRVLQPPLHQAQHHHDELPRTTVVSRPAPDDLPPDTTRPRPIGVRTIDDRASFMGAVLASLAITWVVYEQVLALGGYVGFAIMWWLVFVVVYAAVSTLTHPRTAVTDRLVAVVVASGAGLVGLALATTLVFVIVKGWPALHHLNFYTQDMTTAGPTDPLSKGGIAHALVGSALQVGIATVIALPLGLGTAIYMSEVGGKIARVVRTVVEAMTALPDILAGLFIYTLLIIGFHWERTGFTAALALSVTAIPIIARSAEVTLRVVPSGLREAGVALGASQWQTVWRVVLPTARSGLATALILAVARIVGESAPLLIVASDTTYFNANPFNGPMNSLPLFIIERVRSGQPGLIARGFGAATLLLLIVLVLFAAARFMARTRTGRR